MIEIIPNWHPIFVHFTVALLSVAAGLYLLSVVVSNAQLKQQWRIVARWNLWLGMAITVLTVLTGWYAYSTVLHDEPSHLAMTDHRNWAQLTASLFLLATVWSIIRHRAGKEASALLLSLLLVAMVALGSTAWRGGEVVYRYGLGVKSLPNTGKHGHIAGEFEHGHGNDEDDNHHAMAEKTAPEPSMPLTDEIQTNTKTETHNHHDDAEPHAH